MLSTKAFSILPKPYFSLFSSILKPDLSLLKAPGHFRMFYKSLSMTMVPNSQFYFSTINLGQKLIKKASKEQKISPTINKWVQPSQNIQRKLHKTTNLRTVTGATYKTVLNRVVETCLGYLQAPQERRDKIGSKSRFFYVKQRIDIMTPEEQKAFEEYLRMKDKYFEYQRLTCQSYQLKGHRQKLRKVNINLKALKIEEVQNSPEENPKLLYTYKKIKVSKEAVREYLKQPENGPALHELVIEFLNKENLDFKFWSSDKKDEKEPGVVSELQKINGGKKEYTRPLLKKHVDLVRKRFQELDKTFREGWKT